MTKAASSFHTQHRVSALPGAGHDKAIEGQDLVKINHSHWYIRGILDGNWIFFPIVENISLMPLS